MSTIAISSLPVVTTGLVGDVIPVVQNGVTSQITNANLFNSVNKINRIYVGTGAGTSLTNTTAGNDAMLVNTTSTGNVAIGANALTANLTGSNNVGVGFGALIANTAGGNNVGVGLLALGAATGSFNTAIGRNAGGEISNGAKNTIIGNYSGNFGGLDIRTASNYVVLSDGDGNPRAYWNGANATFNGNLTLTGTLISTVNGVKLGIGAGSSLTNITIGNDSFLANTTGTGNVAVGSDSLKINTTGSNNVSVGFGALIANIAGSNNVAVGLTALGAATGSFNTGVGRNAGGLITSGAKNTIIGNYSGNQGGLDIRILSNYIVLSDGDGNPRAYWNGADATFDGLIGTSAAATTIASATTIAPTKSITFISGTAAVVTITAATGFAAAGGTITLIPTGAFTWTTAGNIAVAGTAVVSRALTMTYDSGTSKWYPSYV